jgi:hypothetical protein
MEIFRETAPIYFARMAIMVFFAILFLQSGWDKIRDRTGNLEWMIPHFASSPFKNLVPLLLTIVTMVEIGAGVACVWAFFSTTTIFGLESRSSYHDLGPSPQMSLALSLVSLALLQLFLGQRIAKDYVGSATLTSYFGIAMLGYFFAMPKYL